MFSVVVALCLLLSIASQLDMTDCAEYPCADDQICIPTLMGHECHCYKGYAMDISNNSCYQFDECSVDGMCHNNANCTDTDGSYICECYPGYDGDGKYNCRDINECKLIMHVETDNVTGEDTNYGHCAFKCINNDGSFECECDEGLTGTGLQEVGENGTVEQFCEDHNECMFDTHDCDQEAHCNNTDGSYHCTCMEGYIGNGWMCSIPDSFIT